MDNLVALAVLVVIAGAMLMVIMAGLWAAIGIVTALGLLMLPFIIIGFIRGYREEQRKAENSNPSA